MSLILDLLLPAPCSVCGRLPSVLCAPCAASFSTATFEFARGGVAGFAAVEYDSACSALFASVKERGQTSVWSRLDAPVGALATRLASTWPDAALLCVPSSKAAMARRGLNPALQLCKRVARAARLPVVGGLRLERQPQDQAALSQQERAANLRDSMRFEPPQAFRRPLIIFDDVVTTGATLLEARRAVQAADSTLRVAGFCVFAETLRKWPPQ